MSDSTIGIKLANGTYYPILKDGAVSKKKLVLTTVKDEQASVQIDLYKGRGEEIQEAVYIGSLVIEEIEKAESGIPNIELVIGIDEEGNLHATANDEVTGDSQSLSVGIQTLDEEGAYEVPDFDLDMENEEERAEEGDDSHEEFGEDDSLEARYTQFEEDDYSGRETREDKPKPFMIVLFAILGLIAIGLLILILVRLFNGPDVPPLQAKNGQQTEVPAEPEKPSEVMKPAVPEKSSETVAESEKPAPEKETVQEPATATKPSSARDAEMASITGIWYKIKRGDTLWDLSSSFYENPWLFPELANKNDILNPDLIFEGNDLYIPNPRQ